MQQLLQFIFQNLVCFLLGFHIVLVGVPVLFLLLPVCQLNLVDLMLQLVHLSLKFSALCLQSVDFVLHLLLLLFRLQCLPHSISNRRFIKCLVGLNCLTKRAKYHSNLVSDSNQEESSFGAVNGNLSDQLIEALRVELLSNGTDSCLSGLSLLQSLVQLLLEV